MRLCTVCRVHPVLTIGMNDQLCNNCMHKVQKHFVGSVVNYLDDRCTPLGVQQLWNRQQGQYFQSFGPHPFGTPVLYTMLDYPGQDPATVVGAAVADAASVSADLNQTDQQSQQIDIAFSNCPNGDPTIIAQWKSFYTGYQKFSQSAHTTLNDTLTKVTATAAWIYNLQQIDNTLQSYVQQLNTWAVTSQKICGGAATQNVPPQGSGTVNTLASITQSVKTLAIIGVAIIAGLYGLSLYEEYKHA